MLFVQTFHMHCDSVQYPLKYHSSDHMLEDKQSFEKLSGLVSSPYEHFNAHIRQAFTNILERRRNRITKTVNVMERNYERAMSHE